MDSVDKELVLLSRDNSARLTEQQRLVAARNLHQDREELEIVTEQIAALKIRAEFLEDRVYAYTSLLSPMRVLPEDVLGEIFLRILPDPSEHYPILSSDEAPLVLCRVCKWWREVACRTPSLWSSIHFVSPRVPPKRYGYDRRKRVLEEWLERSGDLPLSISVTEIGATMFVQQPEDEASKLLISVLQPHAARWRDLTLINVCTNSFRQLAQRSSPNLESLTINSVLRVNDGYVDILERFVLSSQNLKRLNVPALDAVRDAFHLPVQWRNLTELIMKANHSTPTPRVLQMFGKMPQLETLCIMLWYSQPGETVPIVDLLSLRILKISDRTAAHHGGMQNHGLLHYLHTPRLQKLLYHQSYSPQYLGAAEVENSASVESLSLSFPLNLFKHLPPLLKETSSLKNLRLIERRRFGSATSDPDTREPYPLRMLNSAFLNQLSEPSPDNSSEPLLCPKLEFLYFYLTLKEAELGDNDLTALHRFVVYRCNLNQPCLRSVEISFSLNIPLPLEDALLALQAELQNSHPGFVLDLHFIPNPFNDNPMLGVEALPSDKWYLE